MSSAVPSTVPPFAVQVEAGRRYHWCACGRSRSQPFCDGSHVGTGIAPIAWTPREGGRVWLCGCKRTARPPLCDGSHNRT